MRSPVLIAVMTIALGCAGTRGSSHNDMPSASRGTDYRGELLTSGWIATFIATPSGRVLLASMTGTLYTAPHITHDWHEVVDPTKPRGNPLFPSNKPFNGLVTGMAFANDAQGVTWGTMNSGSVRGADTVWVYTTTDAGATWTQHRLGRGAQLAAADIRASGEYWLAGYSRGQGLGAPGTLTTVIYRSSDFGVSWQSMPAPSGSTPVSDFVMDDDGTGVLGILRNQLFVTRDRGQTWTAIATPFDQRAYQKAEYDTDWPRITVAKVARGQLLVVQDGRAFISDIDRIAWRALPTGEMRFVTLDRVTRDWCALNGAWQLRTGKDIAQLSRPSTAGLLAPPVSVECRDRTAYAVDLNGRVYALQADGVEHALPLTIGEDRKPVTQEQQRGAAHWGATAQQLYGTIDDGVRWIRYPFNASAVAGFAARSAHEVLVWDGHGTNSIFDRRTGRSRAVESLAGRDIIRVFDRDSVWIAFGGRQSDFAQRVEVAQTFTAGQFRGSAPFGFVMISRDSGASWSEVDRWDDAGVAALYISPTIDHLVAVSYLGAVRRITRTGDTFVGTTLLTATAENRQAVPYVGTASALHFVSPDTGYIAGDIHHVGRKVFKTVDGGRVWSPAPTSAFPYIGLHWSASGMLGWDRRRLYRVDHDSPTVIATVVADSTKQYISAVAPPYRGEVVVRLQTFAEQRVSRVRVPVR